MNTSSSPSAPPLTRPTPGMPSPSSPRPKPGLPKWNSILASLPEIKKFEGTLKDAATLLSAFETIEGLMARMNRAEMYAGFAFSVDTTDQRAAAMSGRAHGLVSQVTAAAAFLNPEILAIGQKTLKQWMKDEPRLAIYEHHVNNLFRKQEHVRPAEVEQILGMLKEPFSGAGEASSLLRNADMKIPSIKDKDGNEVELSESVINAILVKDDRDARRESWENYHAELYKYKNTLAANLATSIKQNVFLSRVRKHTNALEMMLYEHNIPVEIFHNLLATFKKHLPTWHRYFEIRRKALGLETLEPYDMWAPLIPTHPKVPFTQAIEWIAEGLLPMGKDYVGILRNGALEERWVDVYPNKGKRSGAFSWGAPGTHPFIMMSYTDEVFSVSTLAHELGHSMHSYLTWQNQPFVYADYSLFAAEVASNFHQAMVRGYLLKTKTERDFQIAVIEEAMSNFFRYFFIMPTLARFELETHTRVENGQPLTADYMINLMADLFTEGYGGKVQCAPRPRRHDLVTLRPPIQRLLRLRVRHRDSGRQRPRQARAQRRTERRRKLSRLPQSGRSDYPLDVLKRAGVDLTSSEPVDAAFEVMADYVDRLEKLLG